MAISIIEKEKYFAKNSKLIDQMVIEYDKQSALKLVYKHLMKEGLIESAEALKCEANLQLDENIKKDYTYIIKCFFQKLELHL